MTWTAPMTAVAGSVFTAAQFNQSVRDNLNETGPAKVSVAGQILVASGANSLAARTITESVVATTQTTTSTAYSDLATVGPVVTVNTGAQALVSIYAQVSNSSAGVLSFMAFQVSGSTSIAPNDALSLNSNSQKAGAMFLVTGLTPGSNNFGARYRTPSGTATFSDRRVLVIPL